MSGSEDEEWIPPTEAELKVLAARRERSDKISKLMGDYMLKGYRMLATMCPHCECVELQDRQGTKYCVACQEVDCQETSKDNPALSQRAASGVRAEEAFITQRSGNLAEAAGPSSAPPAPARGAAANPDLIPSGDSQVGDRVRYSREGQLETAPQSWTSTSGLGNEQSQRLLDCSLTVVTEKLAWATGLLKQEQEVTRAAQLAVLVRELAAAIRVLAPQH